MSFNDFVKLQDIALYVWPSPKGLWGLYRNPQFDDAALDIATIRLAENALILAGNLAAPLD